MTSREFSELPYWSKRGELDRLIKKRGEQSSNLTPVELKTYITAMKWYNESHNPCSGLC